MRSITLTTLKRRCRELADMETVTGGSNDFVDDTELLGMINASLGLWHNLITLAVPERYESTQTITANGAASYNLPSDYLMTLGVDYQYAAGTHMELKRYLFQERNQYSSGDTFATGYRLKGDTIVLIPAPTSGTYLHHYVKCATPLASESDTIDGVNGWEEWIVYDVASKLLLKEQSDATQIIRDRDAIEERIRAYAADRDANPGRIVDSRGVTDMSDVSYWSPYFPWRL